MKLRNVLTGVLVATFVVAAFGLNSPTAEAATTSTYSGDVSITEAMPQPNSTSTEYVTIKNESNSDVDVDSWTINDGSDHTVSASSSLSSNSSATICSNPASSSACTDGYSVSGLGLDNSGGDTIALKNDDDNQVAQASYEDEDVEERTEIEFLPSCSGLRNEVGNGNGDVENTDTKETFGKIQEAIDDCDTRDTHTIEVDSGTYSKVMIDKELTLRSVNGKSSTKIKGTVTIADSNTTVGGKGVGFEVTDGNGIGIDIQKTDNDTDQQIGNITVHDNKIHDVGNISGGPNPGDAVGIFVQDGDGVDINGNNIHDITVDPGSVSSYGDGITEAVLIGNNSSPSNITVRNNDINNVIGAVGAFGVNSDAIVSSLSIENNSVSNIVANEYPNEESYKTYAVGVDFTLESSDVSVRGNMFEDFESNGTKSYRPVAVDVKGKNGDNFPSVKLNNFLFASNASSSDYGAGVEHDNPQESNVVDATKNFWNTPEGPDVDDGRSSPGAKVDPTKEVSHSPWLCNEYTGGDSLETTTDGSCGEDDTETTGGGALSASSDDGGDDDDNGGGDGDVAGDQDTNEESDGSTEDASEGSDTESGRVLGEQDDDINNLTDAQINQILTLLRQRLVLMLNQLEN